MTPEEMIKRYATDPEKLSPERRARNEAAHQRMLDKLARGEVSTPKPGDNFPVGLDDDFKPFPLSKRPGDGQPQEQRRSDDQA